MRITEPTIVNVDPGVEYRVTSDGADTTLKEARLESATEDPATWQDVHGSPVVDGANPPVLTPMTNRVEISCSVYPCDVIIVEPKKSQINATS